ncbi:mannitol dehydrogenase family protein [Novosphingobium sp. KN65.2]|uniref:mannitol dehydrogenase family protein n=1 Tax=Novosphingobium sp. KN65.2 TaxID=1478134 RepID=UPI000AC202F9|nr:mannitol dehydrogenase family protein [Novosphingobium sp. KN65.2]
MNHHPERACRSTLQHIRVENRFGYDRDAQATGIVHFGIGAFHRAHQAWYTDRAMDAGDRDWMILGVSLRSAGVSLEMNPQDGLYTVTERSGTSMKSRLVGAVRDVLLAAGESDRLIRQLASPQTRIVTFTVTEKGYCQTQEGTLDFALADATSFYPYLTATMRIRHATGGEGLTLLSCDNLSHNGRQLKRLMRQYLEARAPDLLAWFDNECRCPSTMVDRIVPASTDTDKVELADRIGVEDRAAVFTEPFSQWVIEDDFASGRPRWENVGAQLVADVSSFETAKLRMLNGAHSALAYLGLRAGHEYVHEAIDDPNLRPIVERLMRDEAAPTICASPGQDLAAYASSLLDRFANSALKHRLIQIAMDGSQKIPQRWLATLEANRELDRPCPSIIASLKAWFDHLRGQNGKVEDPLSERLTELAKDSSNTALALSLFGSRGLLAGTWNISDDEVRHRLGDASDSPTIARIS